jgi:CRP/FNR family transcriptional regulator, cyclic AMP receptor protein
VDPWHALLLRPRGVGDGVASDQILSGVEPDFVRLLSLAGTRRKLAADEVLYRRGDPADDLVVVGRGAVTLSVPLRAGVEVPVAVLGAGSVLGSAALLDDWVREATATAAVPSIVSLYPGRTVTELLDRHPRAAAATRTALVRQVIELSERVVESLHLSAAQRIRRRLVALAAAHPPDRLPITQQQLAQLTGSSRATVNAVLAAEARAGRLVVRRGVIVILDVDGIAARAGWDVGRSTTDGSRPA